MGKSTMSMVVYQWISVVRMRGAWDAAQKPMKNTWEMDTYGVGWGLNGDFTHISLRNAVISFMVTEKGIPMRIPSGVMKSGWKIKNCLVIWKVWSLRMACSGQNLAKDPAKPMDSSYYKSNGSLFRIPFSEGSQLPQNGAEGVHLSQKWRFNHVRSWPIAWFRQGFSGATLKQDTLGLIQAVVLTKKHLDSKSMWMKLLKSRNMGICRICRTDPPIYWNLRNHARLYGESWEHPVACSPAALKIAPLMMNSDQFWEHAMKSMGLINELIHIIGAPSFILVFIQFFQLVDQAIPNRAPARFVGRHPESAKKPAFSSMESTEEEDISYLLTPEVYKFANQPSKEAYFKLFHPDSDLRTFASLRAISIYLHALHVQFMVISCPPTKSS